MLGLSFLLLMVVFRSVVLPLLGVVLNLLSAGAAYGLLVWVFQQGHGAGLLGFQQVETIESWLSARRASVGGAATTWPGKPTGGSRCRTSACPYRLAGGGARPKTQLASSVTSARRFSTAP